jgi:hypothetical protein
MTSRRHSGTHRDESVSDSKQMPDGDVSDGRAAFGFPEAVMAHFSFLEGMGYRVVETLDTFVRYERVPLFVNVFHGRQSFELGAEVGRMRPSEDGTCEESFPIRYLASIRGGVAVEQFKPRSATTAEQVFRFVAELGEWLESFGGEVLEGDDATFLALGAAVGEESMRLVDSMRAAELKRRAQDAWRSMHYAAVVLAYDEIESELQSVTLCASEVGRLRYARRQLGM